MSIQNKTLLQFNKISLAFDGKNILDSLSGSIIDRDRIGLVGINGSGKTSLLKCLAGLIKSNSGSVNRNCTIEYIPQLDLEFYRKKTPLHLYLQGIHEDWWQILIAYESIFKTRLSETQLLSTLSGGELVKLNLAVALAKSPEVILLDEPTNHLDLHSLNELKTVLQKTDIAFVVVSHNIDFLNSVVKTIWEIEKCKLTIYGGDYDFYKTEKDNEIQSQIDQFEVERKRLKKIKTAFQRGNIRFQKEKAKFDRMAKTNDRSIPKIARNSMRRNMQTSFGADKVKKEKSIEKTNDMLNTLKLKQRKNICLKLNTRQKSGLVLSVKTGSLLLPSRKLLIDKINFDIYHGDRLAILGDNGSGKTTLVKQFSYNRKDSLLKNVSYGSEYKTLYVDQKYDLINPKATIIKNVQDNNANISYEDVRKVLGNLCFPGNLDIQKNAKILSGGETARLAFAIATSSDIDMLILDEPTNNLDIETVEAITETLKEFQGTIAAISHDFHFLEQIGINEYYLIDNKQLLK
ncbi:MAG: ABC-F family ATP-binding cassette domain-containing protein [Patescibacteria group bacterium]|nr:ATP-binding cassette domain-containing protein [Patescibacteria group bacterium]